MENNQPPNQFISSPQPLQTQPTPQPGLPVTPKDGLTKQELRRYIAEKWVFLSIVGIILTPLIVLGIFYRYSLAGIFYKQKYFIALYDSQTNQPIINASVVLNGQATTTNDKGLAEIRTNVGHKILTLSSKNYQTSSSQVLVDMTAHSFHDFKLQPTGQEVTLTVANEINKSPIKGAVVSADGIQGATNSSGKAILDLPKNSPSISATIKAKGFDSSTVTVSTSSGSVATSQFTLLPVGEILYLANNGNIVSVDKVNLDGSKTQVVLAGVPGETEANTGLIPSNDQAYGALLTVRQNNQQGLYVLNTNSGQLETVNSGFQTSFYVVGWTSNDILIYADYLTSYHPWQYDDSQLMAYNPVTNKTTQLDDAGGLGVDAAAYATDAYASINILGNNNILFTKTWTGSSNQYIGKNQDAVYEVASNGKYYKQLATLTGEDYSNKVTVVQVAANQVDVAFDSNNSSYKNAYYTYIGQTLTKTTNSTVVNNINSPPDSSDFDISASGSLAAWTQLLGAGNAFYVGPNSYAAGKEVALLDPSYTLYGWYGDSYLLVIQNNELYIIPATGVNNVSNLIKLVPLLPQN
jgi:hypothetical protein